jgi:outer membrane protein W
MLNRKIFKGNIMLNKWMLGFLICSSYASYAGMMETINYSGFWGGVGGSYTNTTLSGQTNINQISSTLTSVEYVLSHDTINNLAPVVNVGYYYNFADSWFVGPKFLYKYIGQEQLDQTWSGAFADGSYQKGGLRTKSVQNFDLFLSAGYQFSNWLVYAGAGPGWANARLDLNGSVLPAGNLIFSPVNMSQSKTIIGGAGQVGFEYMLPYRFMVDISYNFLATPKTSIPNIVVQAGSNNYSKFGQDLSVVEQGINITVNKYF